MKRNTRIGLSLFTILCLAAGGYALFAKSPQQRVMEADFVAWYYPSNHIFSVNFGHHTSATVDLSLAEFADSVRECKHKPVKVVVFYQSADLPSRAQRRQIESTVRSSLVPAGAASIWFYEE